MSIEWPIHMCGMTDLCEVNVAIGRLSVLYVLWNSFVSVSLGVCVY